MDEPQPTPFAAEPVTAEQLQAMPHEDQLEAVMSELEAAMALVQGLQGVIEQVRGLVRYKLDGLMVDATGDGEWVRWGALNELIR